MSPTPSPHADPRAFLRALYDAAVARAQPAVVMRDFLPSPPKGRTIAIGGGKASGAMAAALDALWPADAPLSGLVLTRYHHVPPAYRNKPAMVQPSPHGGHNWQPMAFNPQTKLVYIPAQLVPQMFTYDKTREVKLGAWNTGLDLGEVSRLTTKALADSS